MIKGWTSERETMLRDLWAAGLSCSVIADRINARFPGAGLTKNAIVGKVSRIGLKPREASVGRDGVTQKNSNINPKVERKSPVLHGKLKPRIKVEGEAPPKPSGRRNSQFFRPASPAKPVVIEVVQAAPEPPSPPVPTGPLSILDLTATSCRWPIDPQGEDGWRFCGKPRDRKSALSCYCTEHYARSIQRIHRREAA